MEKIQFTADGSGEKVDFFVLEQTKVNGNFYILVASSEEEDAECMVLKDVSYTEDTEEGVYEIVDDDTELNAVLEIFEELLEDVEIER